MGFKCGIVGLPNVGKSTLFNALTKAQIDAANYPFCTIEPNVGVVGVPDPRLDQLASIVKPQKVIPTTMQFVDIAGLVQGASQGEGLGNQFLATIRETEAIAHVVRCFENEDITHVANRIDPVNDIEIIQTELALKDLETIEKALQKASKQAKTGDKLAKQLKPLLEKVKSILDNAETLSLDEEEHTLLKPLNLLTTKPILYIANVDEQGFHDNPHLTALEEYAEKNQAPVVTVCAAFEAEISELSEDDQKTFLNDLQLTEPGLHRVIRAGYDLLNLQTYFTAGVKEVRAWTVPKHCLAPEAAGAIHTDFTKGFIRAEVIGFDDFIQCQGEQGAREAGKLRQEGKNYVVQDGDVIHFLFNV